LQETGHVSYQVDVYTDEHTQQTRLEDDVRRGLTATPKSLPPKYFYDRTGSMLFERITELPEYYPTRQESALLETIAPEIAAHIPGGATLVELGSGASRKTRLLLDAAPQIKAYAPVDISETALSAAARSISQDYPALIVTPRVGDFTAAHGLAGAPDGSPQVGFFPGSTIGNFAPDAAVALMARIRGLLGDGGVFIVGVDLAKDAATLAAAYNDAQGVTAAFNLNLLARINRELGGDFDLSAFAHKAVWNELEGRVEMHLQARRSHTVQAAGRAFSFVGGETIHTENSYKFDEAAIAALALQTRFGVEHQWTDSRRFFADTLLVARTV
jgi:dimethylhistidine N-methyltransferase